MRMQDTGSRNDREITASCEFLPVYFFALFQIVYDVIRAQHRLEIYTGEKTTTASIM